MAGLFRLPERAVAGLLLAVLLAALAGFVSYARHDWRAREAAVRLQSQSLNRATIEHADRSVQAVKMLLAGVAARIDSEPLTDPVAINAMLRQGREQAPQLRGLWFVDAEGYDRSDVPPLYLGDVAFARTQIDRQGPVLQFGAPVRGRRIADWLVPISRRIETPQGQLRGILVAALNPVYFEQFYRQLLVPDQSAALLLAEPQVVIASTDGERAIGEQLPLPPGAGAAGSTERSLGGAPAILSWQASAGEPLVATNTILLAPALRAWRVHVALLALLALLGCGLVVVAARLVLSRDAALKRAAESAANAARTKDDFLSNMNHELRAPLSSVIGFGQLIAAQVHGRDDPRYFEYARRIHESGTHLLRLISDLLDLSKSDSGDLQLDDETFPLHELLHNLRQMFAGQVNAAGLVLEFLPAPSLQLIGDPLRLQQVLINLLSNAIKFTPLGGRITVGAAQLPDRTVVIEIEDSGVGISAGDLDRIFDRFEQGDLTGARTAGGMGIGLTLSKKLVELHGGTIRLTSTPGVGTRASLLLPPWRVEAA